MNLNPIIDEYLFSHEHQRLLQLHRNAEIRTDLAEDLFNIEGSHVHISKALMNLVYNAVEAVRHAPEGLVQVRTDNRYVDRPLGGYSDIRIGEYTVLSVRDNGDGISSEDLERIFEPFYTRKTMGRSGTGLGLTIVWNVMEDHKGYVDVRTGKDGTEFSLYFPAIRDVILEGETDPVFKDYRGNGETVLVIDDLEDQRKVARAILTKLGYRPHVVASGEAALEYLKDHSADILLLDMIMDPGMNGLETYSKILEINPLQKAIIVSGFSETERVQEAQALGVGAYVRKPYVQESLGMAVRKELDRSK